MWSRRATKHTENRCNVIAISKARNIHQGIVEYIFGFCLVVGCCSFLLWMLRMCKYNNKVGVKNCTLGIYERECYSRHLKLPYFAFGTLLEVTIHAVPSICVCVLCTAVYICTTFHCLTLWCLASNSVQLNNGWHHDHDYIYWHCICYSPFVCRFSLK